MTKKAEFNAEEWSLVLQGPPIAGMMVMVAERGGTMRESVSMGQAYAEARKARGQNDVLDEIVAANPEFDREAFRSPEDLKRRGRERLREAVDLLEGKASPNDVEDYKRFVLDLATRVARAHKEGGFLGMGGKEISPAEQETLDEIAATLGEQPL